MLLKIILDIHKVNGFVFDNTDCFAFFHENGCRLSDHAIDEMNDDIIEMSQQSLYALTKILGNGLTVQEMKQQQFKLYL